MRNLLTAGRLVQAVAAASYLAGGCYRLGDRSLWFDEAFSWQLARLDMRELLARTAADVHPPLYYLVLRFWMLSWGDSVFSMRMLSVLFAVTMVLLISLLLGEISWPWDGEAAPTSHGAWARMLASALLLTSPFLYRYACEVRMYTMGGCLALGGSYLLLRASRPLGSGFSGWWIAYAIVRVAGLYTHYWLLFSTAAEWLFVLLCFPVALAPGGEPVGRPPIRRNFVLCAVAVCAAYLPWLPTMLRQWSHVREKYWLPRRLDLGDLGLSPIRLWNLSDTPRHGGPAGLFLALALTALAVVLVRRGGVGRPYLVTMAFGPGLIAAAISLTSGRSIVADRYLFFSYPYLLCCTALVVSDVPDRLIRWSLAVTLLAGNTVNFTSHALEVASRPGVQAAAQGILNRARDGDLVVTGSKFVFLPLKYYLRGRIQPLILLPKSESWDGLSALRAEDLLDDAELHGPPTRTIWVVDMTGWHKDQVPLDAGWTLKDFRDHPELLPTGDGGSMIVVSVFVSKYQKR